MRRETTRFASFGELAGLSLLGQHRAAFRALRSGQDERRMASGSSGLETAARCNPRQVHFGARRNQE